MVMLWYKKGLINKEKFYIPQDLAESYDGSVLRFRISEDEITSKYRSDLPPPPSSFTKPTSSRIQQSEEKKKKKVKKNPKAKFHQHLKLGFLQLPKKTGDSFQRNL